MLKGLDHCLFSGMPLFQDKNKKNEKLLDNFANARGYCSVRSEVYYKPEHLTSSIFLSLH